MATHLKKGAHGEQAACHYLEEKGWSILARNWRVGRDELDIVARDGDLLVVVEVKTRASEAHGAPYESVGTIKQHRMIRAAEAYLDHLGEDLDVRFDIISVVLHPSGTRLEHIEEAFYPTPDEHTE
ncbi:MAG: YraN family protein [Flavobacteriales bacterium]|nr:YraN family protein [Flavobacteriales bacterium]